MSYIDTQLSSIYSGGGSGQKRHIYSTTDTPAMVEQPGYFADKAKRFQAGDWLSVSFVDNERDPQTANDLKFYYVASVDNDGVATINSITSETISVVNNLTSTSETDALSANMGRELNVAKVHHVSSRANMKLLDTSAIPLAYLQEGERSGGFIWDGTVSVATHQGDTNEGIYVPPSAGSDGAYVRIVDDKIHTDWFGLAYGAGDQSVIMQQIINIAQSNNWALSIDGMVRCNGVVISSDLVIDMHNGGFEHTDNASDHMLDVTGSGVNVIFNGGILDGRTSAQTIPADSASRMFHSCLRVSGLGPDPDTPTRVFLEKTRFQNMHYNGLELLGSNAAGGGPENVVVTARDCQWIDGADSIDFPSGDWNCNDIILTDGGKLILENPYHNSQNTYTRGRAACRTAQNFTTEIAEAQIIATGIDCRNRGNITSQSIGAYDVYIGGKDCVIQGVFRDSYYTPVKNKANCEGLDIDVRIYYHASRNDFPALSLSSAADGTNYGRYNVRAFVDGCADANGFVVACFGTSSAEMIQDVSVSLKSKNTGTTTTGVAFDYVHNPILKDFDIQGGGVGVDITRCKGHAVVSNGTFEGCNNYAILADTQDPGGADLHLSVDASVSIIDHATATYATYVKTKTVQWAATIINATYGSWFHECDKVVISGGSCLGLTSNPTGIGYQLQAVGDAVVSGTFVDLTAAVTKYFVYDNGVTGSISVHGNNFNSFPSTETPTAAYRMPTGSVIWRSDAVAGEYPGWINVGTPTAGNWKQMAAIET